MSQTYGVRSLVGDCSLTRARHPAGQYPPMISTDRQFARGPSLIVAHSNFGALFASSPAPPQTKQSHARSGPCGRLPCPCARPPCGEHLSHSFGARALRANIG